MDYRQYKGGYNAQRQKNNNLAIITALLACIIAVECIVIGVLWYSNNTYKTMYDEALETHLNMQKEINTLRENGGEKDGDFEKSTENNQENGVD